MANQCLYIVNLDTNNFVFSSDNKPFHSGFSDKEMIEDWL